MKSTALVVERSLGKGEVVSSILTGSTTKSTTYEIFSQAVRIMRPDNDWIRNGAAAALCLAALAGCAPTYERVFAKAGVPFDQASAETAQCRLVSRGMVPSGGVIAGTPYAFAVASLIQSEATDQSREDVLIECMQARGYHIEKRPLR